MWYLTKYEEENIYKRYAPKYVRQYIMGHIDIDDFALHHAMVTLNEPPHKENIIEMINGRINDFASSMED